MFKAPFMNPYEEPSSTTISERCLKLWGTPGVKDAFISEMLENEGDLPLEDMCQSGGYPSTEDSADCALALTKTDPLPLVRSDPLGKRDSGISFPRRRV
jgi:hypothetical protein